jgi:hypothetical protein
MGSGPIDREGNMQGRRIGHLMTPGGGPSVSAASTRSAKDLSRVCRRLILIVGLALFASLAIDASIASAASPTATIDPNPAAAYTTAQVSGTVDPADQETYYSFEYSTDPATEGWSFFSYLGPIAAGAGTTNVSGELTGLKPGTEYHVRLAAMNFAEFTEYFSDEPNPTFTTESVAAPSASIDPVTTFTGSTAHFSGTVEANAPAGPLSPAAEAAYQLNWHFECNPACGGLNGGTVKADESSHAFESSYVVEADATSLAPGAAYEVRLVAENAGGPAPAAVESFTTATTPPQIESTNVSPSRSEASLIASINPGGLETTYHFEYGPTSSYGQSTPTRTIPASGVPVTVNANLVGLTPGTAYHFRVVATNALEASTGPDQAFRTFANPSSGDCPNTAFRTDFAATLPDCRAYEKVSPAYKADQNVSYAHAQSSPSGDTVAYAAIGAFADSQGSPLLSQYVATRGATGWGTRSVLLKSPTPLNGNSGLYTDIISPDVTKFMATGGVAAIPNGPENAVSLYIRNMLDGSARAVATVPPPPSPFFELFFGGASTDFNHVAFTAKATLTPDAPAGQSNVYEWVDGELHLASILPNGQPAPETAVVAPGPSAPSGRAMSADGSRLFFTVGPGADTNLEGHPLYLRENGTTTQINASQRTPPVAGTNQARFYTASPDGSVAFFSSPDMLTDDATEAPNSENLYRYDANSKGLIDLTPTADPAGAQSRGVMGTSDDGSYVYFVAAGRLDGAQGSEGENNLYVWHEGDGVKFIGILGSGTEEGFQWNPNFTNVLKPNLSTTTNGRFLVFNTTSSLADEDTGGFRQVYRYDAEEGRLTCVSCEPDGDPATGESEIGKVGGFHSMVQYTRPMSEGGARIFFQTLNPLVATDTNGSQDVYEWEAKGAGSCESEEQNGGCLYLISNGTNSSPAYFAEASPDGHDVFFTTKAQLLPEDEDQLDDLYDARVEGGFAQEGGTQACSGEACRGSAASPGPVPIVGSLSFSQAPRPGVKAAGRATVHGSAGALKVTVTGPGKLAWSGPGLLSKKKQLSKAGTSTIKFSLSRAAAKKLAAKGIYKTTLRLTFTETGAAATTKSVALTFKPPPTRSKKPSKHAGKGR